MKSLLTIVFILGFAQNLQALSLRPFTATLESNLTQLQMDNAQFETPVESATLHIDETNKVAKLTIQYKQLCPPAQPGHATCRAVTPEDDIVILPLIEKNKDACGATTYLAQEDKRASDGALTTFNIVDQSTSSCERPDSAHSMTTIEYSVHVQGRGGEYVFESQLAGDILTSPITYYSK